MKFLKQYNLRNYKLLLPFFVLILTSFSVFAVESAKDGLQNRQILGLVLGLFCMIIVSFIDYKWVIKFNWVLYATSIALLLVVSLFGYEVNGAQRWVDLGFTTVQPSEFVKIILILFFANHFSENKSKINELKFLLKSAILLALPILLVLNQPDLSTAISIILVFLTLVYLSGLDYKIISRVLIVIIPTAVILFLYVIQPNQILLKDYQQNRVLAWLSPEEYASDTAYQQNNSKIAIGTGQLTGKGLNNNTTTSVKNGNFILEPQTDFIFAIIGEELGFIGCCGVIILLLLIIIQCIMMGARTYNHSGQLICYGMAAQIAFQSFINMGVATGVLPNTGIPLPFVSYGLSSLVSMFMGVGVVLNIGLQQKKFQ